MLETNRCTKQVIVVIDDDEAIRELLQRFLKLRGYQVETFSSSAEMLEAMESGYFTPNGNPHFFSAVISDMHMGNGMTGIALLKWIRHQRSATPLFLMTAQSSPELAAEAKREGISEFFPKPFPLETLAHSLQRALA